MSNHAGRLGTRWWPLVALALGQAQLSWNSNVLPISVGSIGAEFGAGPAVVVSAIVAHSLGVAGFTMLGARLGQRWGPLATFRAMTVMFVAAMLLMATSRTPAVLIGAQLLAGLAAAVILPALVVLTTHHYEGRHRATALGVLAGAQAVATVVAFLVAGVVGTYLGWRWSFALVVPLSLGVLLLSARLEPVPRRPGLAIDGIGVILAVIAVTLLSIGFDSLENWGWLLALPTAPVSLVGLSPAPFMIVGGAVAVQFFLAHVQHRVAVGKEPLLAPAILQSRPDRAAIVCILLITVLSKAITFLIPLYMQVVQGRSGLQTASAMIPHQLAVLVAAIMVVRLYERSPPRQIARLAFGLVTVGTLLLATTVRNDWSDVLVVLGLVCAGLGQGALSTLLFNVLVSSAPATYAPDVGALRSTVSHLAAAMGTALAGAVAVALLSASVQRAVKEHPTIPSELISQVPLDSIRFVSNDRLRMVLAQTAATEEQVDAAIEINSQARLQALNAVFLLLSAVGLVALAPAGRLAGSGTHPKARITRKGNVE